MADNTAHHRRIHLPRFWARWWTCISKVHLPGILNALECENASMATGWCSRWRSIWARSTVRTIAMDSTEGLVRGPGGGTDTGGPITVPVGPETLGRIINVIGEPIDDRGPVETHQAVFADSPSRPRR